MRTAAQIMLFQPSRSIILGDPPELEVQIWNNSLLHQLKVPRLDQWDWTSSLWISTQLFVHIFLRAPIPISNKYPSIHHCSTVHHAPVGRFRVHAGVAHWPGLQNRLSGARGRLGGGGDLWRGMEQRDIGPVWRVWHAESGTLAAWHPVASRRPPESYYKPSPSSSTLRRSYCRTARESPFFYLNLIRTSAAYMMNPTTVPLPPDLVMMMRSLELLAEPLLELLVLLCGGELWRMSSIEQPRLDAAGRSAQLQFRRRRSERPYGLTAWPPSIDVSETVICRRAYCFSVTKRPPVSAHQWDGSGARSFVYAWRFLCKVRIIVELV